MSKKEIIASLILGIFIITLIILIITLTKNQSNSILLVQQEQLSFQQKNRQAELIFIRSDLDEYEFLSTKLKDNIVNTIDIASKEYNLPPILLHAIFQIESDYRFNIDHPIVNIKIKGKLTKCWARGLGGIMWDCWSDSLKSHNIAETSSDLYIPQNNIEATGFILKDIINKELQKSNDIWIISRIVKQYYGDWNHDYEQKLKEVTSKLWIKRIGKEILESKDTLKTN